MRYLLFTLVIILTPRIVLAQPCTPTWCSATMNPWVCNITLGLDSCKQPCYKPSPQWPVVGCLPITASSQQPRVCGPVFSCRVTKWNCSRKVQDFIYANFQTWLMTNPNREYTVLYSSADKITIEYMDACNPDTQCSDEIGICVRK